MIVYEVAKSKNTSSLYGFVEIFNGPFEGVTGWVSLRSHNLKINM